MKVHARNVLLAADDFKGSPHIYKSLKEGTYAACGAGVCPSDCITDNPQKITCKACAQKQCTQTTEGQKLKP